VIRVWTLTVGIRNLRRHSSPTSLSNTALLLGCGLASVPVNNTSCVHVDLIARDLSLIYSENYSFLIRLGDLYLDCTSAGDAVVL
jgi:hypothetical protein